MFCCKCRYVLPTFPNDDDDDDDDLCKNNRRFIYLFFFDRQWNSVGLAINSWNGFFFHFWIQFRAVDHAFISFFFLGSQFINYYSRYAFFCQCFQFLYHTAWYTGDPEQREKKTHRTIQMKQWDKLKVLFFCLLIWSYGAPAVYTGDCCIIIIWQLDSFGFFSGEKKATLFLLHTMFNDTFFPSILSIFRVA